MYFSRLFSRPALVSLTLIFVFLPGCFLANVLRRPPEKKLKSHSWDRHPTATLIPLELKPETVLFKNANIMTAAGVNIKGGYLLIKEGRIKKISEQEIQAPPGTKVIEAKGKFLTPGLIDTHSHLGVYPSPAVSPHADGNEMTNPNTADVRALDAIWPQDPGFERALAGGVTTLQILPGSGNLIGGQGVTIKLHRSISSAAMRFPGAPTGLKMACGENPKRVYGRKGRRPSTRMGTMAAWRSYFILAQGRLKKVKAYNNAVKNYNTGKSGGPPKTLPENPILDVLAGALTGDVLVHVHCYRADEMVRVLELAETFDFKVRSFHHAAEAYKIRKLLAAREVAVSTWVDWWGFKIEAQDAIPYNPALISQAGARAIIHSDDPLDVQRLNQEAARALAYGREAGLSISEDEALRWVTLNPAWALGIDRETGSLEEGKMADLTLWSAHPFSVYARAELVYIDGVRSFDYKKKNRKPWSDFESFSRGNK